MSSSTEWSARGKVTAVSNGKVHFAPSNTNYDLHLECSPPYAGPIGELITATVRAKAKKVYTVPSGGGFISPIFGPPRTIQGRALHVQDGLVVIRAGCPIVVELPKDESGVDLEEGPISVGSIVNAVALPGVRFELGNVKIVK
jgi:hypothetical protein